LPLIISDSRAILKFAYIDESGTGDEPFAVMAGVVVDAYRMRPTKDDWDVLLGDLSAIVQREVKEFHTRDFYAGNSPWRNLKGDQRAAIITAIFQWLTDRGHHIVFSAIDKSVLREKYSDHPFTESLGSLWKILGTHLALSIQRSSQRVGNNKGNTVLVFDAHTQDEKEYAELILNPPEWTDTYYNKGNKQNRLDQIIDVPHFVDSSHVGMIQLADCISYFLHRHMELVHGGSKDRYDGETETVAGWATSALDRCVSLSSIYPKRQRCDAAEYFYQLAPSAFK